MNPVIRFDDVDERGPQQKAATLDFEVADLDSVELDRIGPVLVEAEVSRGDHPAEYVARGSVEYSAELRCSRCLDPYPVATLSPFAVRFRPRPAPGTFEADQEIEIAEEDLDVEHYTEREVSLRHLAAEQIQLSLPMKPLCEEACLGLCAKCGANLNREACSCADDQGDERWGALREIRETLVKKKDI